MFKLNWCRAPLLRAVLLRRARRAASSARGYLLLLLEEEQVKGRALDQARYNPALKLPGYDTASAGAWAALIRAAKVHGEAERLLTVAHTTLRMAESREWALGGGNRTNPQAAVPPVGGHS